MGAKRSLLLITTGGTIDSEPYPESESDYPSLSTHKGICNAYQALEDIIRHKGGAHYKMHHTPLFAKDSKHLDTDDQSAILRQILHKTTYWRIVITIGTDRMVDIAENIRKQIKVSAFKLPCPVIFTGAIWPLSNGADKSDGFENLELAAFGHDNLSPDIYVAMHSIMATPDHIKKDIATKTFIRIDP
jgi:L-asparaginase/Glu-tRNA(Gln) amidotransferase subunit D